MWCQVSLNVNCDYDQIDMRNAFVRDVNISYASRNVKSVVRNLLSADNTGISTFNALDRIISCSY